MTKPFRIMHDASTDIRFAVSSGRFICSVCGRRVKGKGGCPEHRDDDVTEAYGYFPDPWDVADGKTPPIITRKGILDDRRERKRRENYKANKGLMASGHSVWGLPRSDVAWVIGSGPSLSGNLHMLTPDLPGVKIGANAACEHVGLDYLVCVDRVYLPKSESPGTTLVLDAAANADLLGMEWKDVCWIRQRATGGIISEIAEDWPNMMEYTGRFNVMPAIFTLLAEVIKPKVIMLVGCDCGATEARNHIGEQPISQTPAEGHWLERDENDAPVVMNYMYSGMRDTLHMLCTFATLHGIGVLNCTGGGVLPETYELNVAARAPMSTGIELARTVVSHGR